ncbi:MAG TPA: hypothetical protein VMF61_02955 [Candidatus Acidoferrales bacterium]|nr:hypothetical protein [Candidatus Acidoferrales bacterium]
MTFIGAMLRDERGGTIVEYALVFAFLALVCAFGFITVANSTGQRYATSTNQMSAVQESPLPTISPGT